MIYIAAIVFMTALTAVLTSLLWLAHRTLQVREDPRIDSVEAMLPHANCGACGYPGCRAFAEALVSGVTLPGQCSVSDDAGRVRIARYLGVEVGNVVKRVARLACAGGSNVAADRAVYTGLPSCRAAAQVGGGGKGCAWGCLGLGDCAEACQFDALHMNEHRLPVVDEARCTACGDCVRACPKDLFSIHTVDDQLWVACRNLEAGDDVLQHCQVGCTGCGRCAMDAPEGSVEIIDNLAVVHYDAGAQDKNAIERCPTGAIVWIEKDGQVTKGVASPKIIRRNPLQTMAS